MDKNAIIFLIILFTFLSPPNTYLSLRLQHSSLSLSLSLSVAPYFFLTFIFLISHSLPLSLHFSIIVGDPTRFMLKTSSTQVLVIVLQSVSQLRLCDLHF